MPKKSKIYLKKYIHLINYLQIHKEYRTKSIN